MITVCHISDTHCLHNELIIPKCDFLFFTGDIYNQTSYQELHLFLEWLTEQPAKYKVFIAGNHDLVLDKSHAIKYKNENNTFSYIKHLEDHDKAIALLEDYRKYNIYYLNNSGIILEDVRIFGMPQSPSFNRHKWAFNADRGKEMMKYIGRIPSDTEILLTHGPAYGYLDYVVDRKKLRPDEDDKVGCVDLLNTIKNRMLKLKLHAFGHIHNQYGIINVQISKKRTLMVSNGALLNEYTDSLITTRPYLIYI